MGARRLLEGCAGAPAVPWFLPHGSCRTVPAARSLQHGPCSVVWFLHNVKGRDEEEAPKTGIESGAAGGVVLAHSRWRRTQKMRCPSADWAGPPRQHKELAVAEHTGAHRAEKSPWHRAAERIKWAVTAGRAATRLADGAAAEEQQVVAVALDLGEQPRDARLGPVCASQGRDMFLKLAMGLVA